MDKVGGKRNYGYGKTLNWAGKNALADRYGEGHFGTKAAHEERWRQFTNFAKQEGIKDARHIELKLLERYASTLNERVQSEEVKVAYAQNLLSTVNVVLETFRKDNQLRIQPAQWVGNRSQVRTIIPATIQQAPMDTAVTKLISQGQNSVALIAQLARAFGLRFKEASLFNARRAVRQGNRHGRINITLGTKGGRGKGVSRWVPVNTDQLKLLQAAADHQGTANNLMQVDKRYNQWRDHAYYLWRVATEGTGINGFHDLRAAYACQRYQELTGYPAPVLVGGRGAPKELDMQARVILSQELGHNRIDVLAAYIGSSR